MRRPIAQYRSWCAACVRGRGVAMKHFRGASAQDERMHTFVMDCCLPSQGDLQGMTVLVVKEVKTRTVGAFTVPSREVSEYFVKTVVDITSGCGCGRTILKSDCEPAMVALQEAVKIARQSDTILENSPKRRQPTKRSSGDCSEGSTRNDTNVEKCSSKTKRTLWWTVNTCWPPCWYHTRV